MKIETTREITDEVWVLHKDKIQQLKIRSIFATVGQRFRDDFPGLKERFDLVDEKGEYVVQMEAAKCFTAKQELLRSLE